MILVSAYLDQVKDPRLSAAQGEALRKVLDVDDGATIEGLDAKYRPVVNARLGSPRRKRTYSLARNGDPVRPLRPLVEIWHLPEGREAGRTEA